MLIKRRSYFFIFLKIKDNVNVLCAEFCAAEDSLSHFAQEKISKKGVRKILH